MITLASYLLTALVAVLAVPSAIFSIEIVAALFLARRHETPATTGADRRGRIAVLIPAHNEASGLLPTLNDIKAQLGPTDRLLVVADNCTDDTATIASSTGAEVTVRSDLTKIGKGYALDWGLNYLASSPPDIVIMLDADCLTAEGSIDHLATVCEQTQRPVQSLYLMTSTEGSKINHQVAEFAWRVKNWVRPLGLSALGLPCQLMGSGMAFPWSVIRSVKLSSGFIVEDLKLGLDLAKAGHAPIFCPSAVVTSTFPNSVDGAKAQRQRWEHGQLGLILSALPYVVDALKRRDFDLATLVLDLLVPPLSLFGLILSTTTLAMAFAPIIGLSAGAFAISLTCLCIVSLVALSTWVMRGRDILPPRSLALLPSYLGSKLRLYVAAILGQRISVWVRSDRN